MAKVRILESSQQAKIRNEAEKQRCPECGSTKCLGSVGYEYEGIFIWKRIRVETYRCMVCKCKFEIRESC